MKKVKLKRSPSISDLSAALDKSAEAAVALGVSEGDLVSRLLKSVRSLTQSTIVQLPVQPQRKMYNPEAGP